MTRISDDFKNASFGQDEKTNHKSVSINILSFSLKYMKIMSEFSNSVLSNRGFFKSTSPKLLTDAKRNFATHSNLPVEIKDKVDRLKVFGTYEP